MSAQTKYLLGENQMPKFWYNIQADLPKPLPPVLHPGTMQPIGPDDLAPLFPMSPRSCGRSVRSIRPPTPSWASPSPPPASRSDATTVRRPA